MSDFFAPSYWYGAGPGAAFASVNNAVAYNQANMIPNMNANMAYVGGQNQAALAAAQPMPPGYGEVHLPYLSGSFGEAAAPGTYSPGSGLSSFSGSSLGGYGAAQMSPWERSQMELSMNPGATANVPSSGSIGSMDWLGGYNPYGQTYQPPAPTYNAPRQYGWDANEGAPVPQQAAPAWPMGQFRPQTYGWDANEGATYTPPPQQNWDDIWHRALPLYMPPTSPSTVTVPGQQGSLGSNFLSAGGGFSNSGADPWGGGGYDISAQSRAIQSPLQGFDWGQSYGTRGGQNADMLRAAGGASSGYYNPQLDWMSQSTLGMGMGGAQLPSGQFGGENTNTYGYPASGYLGMQGIYQDPFSGFVRDQLVADSGGMDFNYLPRYDAQPGWSPVDNQGQKHFIGQ
jgi:hypothetical protein